MQVFLYKQIEDLRRADQRRDADIWRLLRQGKSRPPSWLPRTGCWLLCQIGRWLVGWGEGLRRAGASYSGQMTT